MHADTDAPDWEFIVDGAVTLFWREQLFDDAKHKLRALDYRLVEIACSTLDRFTNDLGAGLGWKDQFGYEPWTGGIDALDDGLREPRFGPANSLALCFEGFDHIVAEDAQWAISVLDAIERQSRNNLLHGRRLIALVQTSDGAFFTPTLGGAAASWNRSEWFTASRHPPVNDH